jgi:serine/threonine-protein kinase
MPLHAVADLVQAIQRTRLLEPDQFHALQHDLQGRFADPKSLARELLQRGWLTAYQINQIFLGHGPDLLLGSYVLLERLGEGGMGVVFKARNWKLGRVVALKVIRKERLARPDAVRRFRREIQAAAQLSHPNVVEAHDADEVDGTHFFAMEYAEGTDLARLVKQQGPLPVARACDYVRQAALGLQHAYEHNLIHRDIKPSNLLLTRGGVIKVLDMGLARLEQADDDSSTLTQEGVVMGTPDYIAPEQALDARLADIRADIYSLGCSFYFLLTGRPPFPSGTLMQKLLKHRMDEPEPVERLRPEVPAGVAAVLRRMLAKQPEARFQTPAELAAALAVWDRTAIQAGPGGQAAAPARVTAGIQVAAAPPLVAEAASDTGVHWSSVMVAPSMEGPVSARLRQQARGWSWRRFNLIAGAALFGCLVVVTLAIFLATRGSKPAPPPAREDPKEPPSFADLTAALRDPARRTEAITELLRYPDRPEATEAVLVGLTLEGPVRDRCRVALADHGLRLMPHLVEAARRGRFTPDLLAQVQQTLAVPMPLKPWRFAGPFLFDPVAKDPIDLAALGKPPDDARTYLGVGGKQVGWSEVPADPNGRVDLGRFYKTDQPWVAFGYTEVEFDEEREGHIVVPAADDFLVVWLNGRKVGESAFGNRKFLRATFQKGRNALAVRVDNRGGNTWYFALRVVGQALPDDLLTPPLVALFEDEAALVTQLDRWEGLSDSALELTDRFSGTAALKVTPKQRYAPALPHWYFPIAQRPGVGQYRYLRFAWKKRGGDKCMLQLSAHGNWDNRYFAGRNPPYPAYVLQPAVPDTWQVHTVDLFAHFRGFTLTGLSVAPFDGECLLLDHVYLARSLDDLKRLRTPATEAAQAPKPVYLSDLNETDVLVGHGQFGKNGDLGYGMRQIQVNGAPAPRGLSLHPPSFGSSRVSYPLDKRYAVFRTTAAINDTSPGTVTPLTFMVLGDGKLLWKSKPLQRRGDAQECSVPVTGVERLQLMVQCPGPHGWAFAVWVDPHLIEEPEKPR